MKRVDPTIIPILQEPEVSGLRLRPINEHDTDYIVKWRNSDVVRSQFIFREDLTPQMHMDWLYNKVFTGSVIQFIIEVGENNTPIGSIYIRDIDLQNESGEFGIFIGENKLLSKGYGSKAIRLFIPYCFSLGFNRIFLRVLSDNLLAQSCYQKNGFVKEGTAREMVNIAGKPYDIVFMSILKNDFNNDAQVNSFSMNEK